MRRARHQFLISRRCTFTYCDVQMHRTLLREACTIARKREGKNIERSFDQKNVFLLANLSIEARSLCVSLINCSILFFFSFNEITLSSVQTGTFKTTYLSIIRAHASAGKSNDIQVHNFKCPTAVISDEV